MLNKQLIALRQIAGVPNHKIRDECRLRLMSSPADKELQEIKEDFSEGRPARIHPGSDGTTAWLMRHGLVDGFFNSKPYKEADTVIQPNRNARRIVEALLLANIPHDEVAELSSSRAGVNISRLAVTAYENFFFDWKNANSDVLRSLFTSGPDGRMYRTVFMSGRAEVALWKLGFKVDVGLKDALHHVANEAFMRFVETTTLDNGMSTAMAAGKWYEILTDAHARIVELSGTGKVAEIVEILRKVEMQTANPEIKSIEELK